MQTLPLSEQSEHSVLSKQANAFSSVTSLGKQGDLTKKRVIRIFVGEQHFTSTLAALEEQGLIVHEGMNDPFEE